MIISSKFTFLLLLLFSFLGLSLFYVTWKEPTLPDEISLIPMKLIDAAQKIKDKDKQLQFYDSIKGVIRSTLQKKPNDPTLQFYLGYIYTLTENYTTAISIHLDNMKTIDSIANKITYGNSKNEIARNYYLNGIKLLESKNVNEGVISLNKSFNYVPYFAPSSIKLAILNIDNNKIDSAKKMLTESIRLNPQDPVLYNILGYAFFKENNLKESENYFSKAHELDPNNEDANKFLNMIRNQTK